MKRIFLYILFSVAIILPATSQMHFKTDGYAAPKGKAKNFIIIVVNGLSNSQLSAVYTKNKGSLPNLSRFESTGFMAPWVHNTVVPSEVSAASVLATGKRPINNAFGYDNEWVVAKNLFEQAIEKNMSTAIVTTGSILEPVPMAFTLHAKNLKNPEALATDFSKLNIDFILAGGSKYFDQRADQVNLLQNYHDRKYDVENKEKHVGKMHDNKVVALVGKDDIYRYTVRGEFLTKGSTNAIQNMLSNPFGFLTLINLSKTGDACRANDEAFLVEELNDLDKMLGSIFNLVGADQQTLILVTGTAEIGGMSIDGGDRIDGNVKAGWKGKETTAALVPVFAHGPMAELFSGFYENTEFYARINSAMALRKY